MKKVIFCIGVGVMAYVYTGVVYEIGVRHGRIKTIIEWATESKGKKGKEI